MAFKALPSSALELNEAGHKYASYFAWLDDGFELEDIFPSTFWMHYQAKLRTLDMIRLRRRDGSFDLMVIVMSQADNGELLVEPWPKYRNATEMSEIEAAVAAKTLADNSRPSVVPLHHDGEPRARVQHLPATGWRVIGWNGQEVSRNHKSEAEAKRALDRYLRQLNMTMPEQPEIDAAKARIAAAVDAKKKPKEAA